MTNGQIISVDYDNDKFIIHDISSPVSFAYPKSQTNWM